MNVLFVVVVVALFFFLMFSSSSSSSIQKSGGRGNGKKGKGRGVEVGVEGGKREADSHVMQPLWGKKHLNKHIHLKTVYLYIFFTSEVHVNL